MDKIAEIIKKTTEDILSNMGFSAGVQVKEDEHGHAVANISVDEGGTLIGQGGENLLALQHIIRLVVFKKIDSEAEETESGTKKALSFVVDINGYRQEKIEILRELALDRADQVAREGRSFVFRPMSSYERRIVHMALSARHDVICESEGDGLERHVVVRAV